MRTDSGTFLPIRFSLKAAYASRGLANYQTRYQRWLPLLAGRSDDTVGKLTFTALIDDI
jgi:hypothetical protein